MRRREAAHAERAFAAVLLAGLVTLALLLLAGLPEARPGGLTSHQAGSGLVLAAGPRAAATVSDVRLLPRAALVTIAEADDPAGEPRAAVPGSVSVPHGSAAGGIRPSTEGPLPAPAARLPERPPRLA